jgi:ubiquinone/menaquinone biosynthesis C-methylase UbiE
MKTEFSQALFDNPEVWDSAAWQKRVDDLERARLAAEWLPSEINSVLDVGCGNGVFTNLLESNRFKVGLDMSRIALQHITAPRLQADASLLPFTDRSFDACLSMEMLEHLPIKIYQNALNELVRVSRKYILVTVPYKEKLKYNTVICPNCLHVFHPYNHIRQYQQDEFKSLFGAHSRLVRLEAVVPTKSKVLPRLWNIIRLYQHRQGRNFPINAICPQCGYTPFRNTVSAQNPSRAHSMRSSLGYLWPKRNTFTWWMAFYRKEA